MLGKEQYECLKQLLAGDPFDLELPKPVWARMVYDFSAAYAVKTLPRKLLGELLLALYKRVVFSGIQNSDLTKSC